MLRHFFKWARSNKEHGFTLIEIITVVAILGILSATATPVYNAVKRHAAEAALKSDVRQGAMEMEKEAVLSKTGYAAQLPATFYESTGNVVVIDADSSSKTAFCIIGTHPSYEDMFIYYHSDKRVVGEDQGICGFKNPEDYGPLPISPEDVQRPEGGIVSPIPSPTPEPSGTPSPTPEPTIDPTAAPQPTLEPTATPNPNPTETPTEEPEDSASPNPTLEPTLPPSPTVTPPPTYVPPPPTGYDDPKRNKYTICHKGGNQLNLPLPAILNGHSKNHLEDIVPPIPGKFTGQNWTIEGAKIWHNNCHGL